MPFHISVTGRLIDPLGSGISGASVYFTSKATSRGLENVPQTADAYFTTDSAGYYSTSLASGWYKLSYKEPGWLEAEKIGVATVSGIDSPIDLGTLINNSVPPPSFLQDVGNVDSSGLANGSLLVYNAARNKWTTTITTGAFVTSAALNKAVSGKVGTFYQELNPVGNAAQTVTDLMSVSIAGSTLGDNGDRLRINSIFSTTSGDRHIRAFFGGVLVYDVLVTEPNFSASLVTWNGTGMVRPTAPLNVHCELFVTRISETGANVWSTTRWDDYDNWRVFHLAPLFTGFPVSLGSAQTLKFDASGVSTNAVTQRELVIEFLPRP